MALTKRLVIGVEKNKMYMIHVQISTNLKIKSNNTSGITIIPE